MRGRKPKPAAAKIAAGNPGHRPLNAHEPKPPEGAPDCPPELSDAARAVWEETARALAPTRVLTQADLRILKGFCLACVAVDEATAALEGDGKSCRFYTAPSGRIVAHPAVAAQLAALRAVREHAAILGLDPSSRSRIVVPPAPADNSKARFFKIHGG